MRKNVFLLLIAAVLGFSSCETDYYEPVFGYDNLPAVISQRGGIFGLTYSYEYYDTKALRENFEWEYRILIDGREYDWGVIKDHTHSGRQLLYFDVQIPRNDTIWPRGITVEVSTHVKMGCEDWWGDWTPIASGVQLSL